jgi:hypothetical protein
MEPNESLPTQRRKPRVWLATVQMIVLTAFLLTAVGASGIFAFQLCPGCPPQRPDYEPYQQLPEELEKDTKSTK